MDDQKHASELVAIGPHQIPPFILAGSLTTNEVRIAAGELWTPGKRKHLQNGGHATHSLLDYQVWFLFKVGGRHPYNPISVGTPSLRRGLEELDEALARKCGAIGRKVCLVGD